MDDGDFIIGLMKTETDALGFIPSSAIRSRWMTNRRYIIQRDRRGRRRGYLLHGPALPGQPLFVNQICMEYDHRLRGYATIAVRTLILRAKLAGSSDIRLKCALDLEANAFWQSCGFILRGFIPGGLRRRRTICQYSLPLQPETIGIPTR